MAALAALAPTTLATACGGTETTGTAASAGGGDKLAEVRLGYFPNLTHATALVGIEKGLFARHLGSTKLTTGSFNAGPAAIKASFAGAIDATCISSNPAIHVAHGHRSWHHCHPQEL